MVVGFAARALLAAFAKRSEVLMSYEDEIVAKYATPGLCRNVLSRQSKKLNMEFDAQFNKMTKEERDEFLDAMYPE